MSSSSESAASLSTAETPVESLECDYLVIGAGAMGMAFVDELVTASSTASVILVDRRLKPGGHWNDAYSFVTLHQPATYYGVNSEPLGAGGEDLASGAEIRAYYERVLKKLCATGRVRFYSQCTYEGEGRFRSLVAADQSYRVTVHRKTVDATYSRMQVPSTRPPTHPAAEGIALVPINALSTLTKPWARYVVIGAGKTGMDAALFLLDSGVEPDRITWIVPNDAWLINRATTIPGIIVDCLPKQMVCMMNAKDGDDLLDQFEAEGWLFRLDTSVRPTRFRCATVTREELKSLQRIRGVVRLGRVTRIDSTEIVLADGCVPTGAEVLHIDCSADGLARRPARPVFEGDRIILQPIAMCQQVMSAAAIARAETWAFTDETNNALCKPVPHPVVPLDFLEAVLATGENLLAATPSILWWMLTKRLSMIHHVSWYKLVPFSSGCFAWGSPRSRMSSGYTPRSR